MKTITMDYETYEEELKEKGQLHERVALQRAIDLFEGRITLERITEFEYNKGVKLDWEELNDVFQRSKAGK